MPDIIDRLFARLEWQGDCLVWTGSLTSTGYGQIGEVVVGKRFNRKTHRLLYERTMGPLAGPQEMVLHSCDNPPCCNPEHLHTGSCADNAREAVERGLHASVRKTQCPRQHPYDEVNTYLNPKGRRECRTCRYEKKVAARAAGARW